jgi:hypothetical protein
VGGACGMHGRGEESGNAQRKQTIQKTGVDGLMVSEWIPGKLTGGYVQCSKTWLI